MHGQVLEQREGRVAGSEVVEREPNAERKFRAPAAMLIGPLGILGCLYLFWSLPAQTRWYFLLWNVIGLAVYALWAQRQAARSRAWKSATSSS